MLLPLVTLIPAIICLLALSRGGTQVAFLKVVLPVLLLLPTNFDLLIPHLPIISMADAALFPLGVGMIFMDMSRWKLSRMDLYVVLFVISRSITDWRYFAEWRALPLTIVEGVFPYMVGKLLVEQPGTRLEMIRRFISLVTVASTVGMYEFFLKVNPYRYFWSHFYPGQWGGFATSIRHGFGRLAGPYTDSEHAGMMIVAAIMLAVWLFRQRSLPWASNELVTEPLKYPKLVLVCLALTLAMTQARGPWIGAVVGFGIASVGRARFPLRRALLLGVLGITVGIPAYLAVKQYTSGPRTDFGSEKETAQYRAELIDNYVPVAEAGGAWGWGRSFPIIGGQLSIDNDFLLVWLVQGSVGIGSLLLLYFESAVKFFRVGLKTRSFQDRYLVFSLLGILVSMAVTLGTVALFAQAYQLLFLLFGWSQAIRPAHEDERSDQLGSARQTTRQPAQMVIYT